MKQSENIARKKTITKWFWLYLHPTASLDKMYRAMPWLKDYYKSCPLCQYYHKDLPLLTQQEYFDTSLCKKCIIHIDGVGGCLNKNHPHYKYYDLLGDRWVLDEMYTTQLSIRHNHIAKKRKLTIKLKAYIKEILDLLWGLK